MFIFKCSKAVIFHPFRRAAQFEACKLAARIFSAFTVELCHLHSHVNVTAALKVFACLRLRQVFAYTCQLINNATVCVRLSLLHQLASYEANFAVD